MSSIFNQRIDALRQVMQRESVDAYILDGTDPHLSEYVPDRWKTVAYISGFTGSAGTVVVTLEAAALWTDSRYFVQAQQELAGTGIMLMRDGLPDTPSMPQWIGRQLRDSKFREVAIDGDCWSENQVRQLKGELRRQGGVTLRTNLDALQTVWTDRPAAPKVPVVIQPLEYAGEHVSEKLQRIRRALRERHADGMLMAALDDVAWTLNLRGGDIECNPLFMAYLLIASDRATLFVDPCKVSDEVRVFLHGEGVGVDDYSHVAQAMRDYFEYNILLDPDQVNHRLFHSTQREVVESPSPVPAMKAVKNAAEQRGFKLAMLRDGIAMTRFLCWLDTAVAKGGVTECSAAEKLRSFRAEQPLFRGLSFETIAAYQEHGAIVHYEPTAVSDVELHPKGLFLVDSGGQYLDGTTDITRTIALGPLTEEQRRVYTLVLKAHIRLQLAIFPEGTTGTQLDAVARGELWRQGLHYMHGTGHGVGAYLCVHEGPHQIRMQWKPTPLCEGMTVTNEPGVYLENRFGVRIENTLLVVSAMETECGRFLRFEPLTICPIDLRPIMPELLAPDEVAWLDGYHSMVCEALSPYLNPTEQAWLQQVTRPL
ncbi:MAG: aminopeptidase P family protein [Prevotella sp.]|nr:aminopeptidase P family protein [Prevotella sp.]